MAEQTNGVLFVNTEQMLHTCVKA